MSQKAEHGRGGVFLVTTAAGPGISLVAQRRIEYRVTHVDHHVFDIDASALADLLDGRPSLFVVDRQVEELYRSTFRDYVDRRVNCVDVVLVDGHERAKTLAAVEDICRCAVRAGLRRDGAIVAVGGGVTLDVAGLAASLYRRGVRYVRVPTTLVGMVDVGIGIKQAVNEDGKKNVLGAFYAPFGCINDVSFLATLPARHLSCGVSEIVKMAMLRDPVLFELLEAHAADLIASCFQSPALVSRSVLMRAEIAMMHELQPNLYEQDLHRLVDFGHSFSPWLEASSGYELHHGEAVAVDMMISTALAVHRGLCDRTVLDRLAALYEVADLPKLHALCEPKALVESLHDIRIHRGGDLNLVLPTGIGNATFVQDVEVSQLGAAIEEVRALRRERAYAAAPSRASGQSFVLAGG